MSDTRKTSSAARDFTKAMRDLFDVCRLSERRAALILLVSPTFVHRALHGRRMFTPAHVEVVCAALGVPDDHRRRLHLLGAKASGWDVQAPSAGRTGP